MATSLNPSSNLPPDIWDIQTRTKQKTPAVRDDWEDDDEDETDVIEDDRKLEEDSSSSPANHTAAPLVDVDKDVNKKIWEAANGQHAIPMPTLLSSRTGSAIPPPAAAFQPAMRILKRPASSSSSQGSPVTSLLQSGETIQDREVRYAAARERIFGPENSESVAVSAKSVNSVKIIREPRAPDTASGKQDQQSGFKGRGGKTMSSARPLVDS